VTRERFPEIRSGGKSRSARPQQIARPPDAADAGWLLRQLGLSKSRSVKGGMDLADHSARYCYPFINITVLLRSAFGLFSTSENPASRALPIVLSNTALET
jgi:hypothetical protein